MSSLLDNPDLMQSILLANPSTRALLDSNPQIRSALLDPDTLRTMMSAARNPAVMAEMTRNQDRALANIEAMPGGFAALSRVFREVGEPLEASLREGLGAGAAAENDTPVPTGGGTTALPNPWAPRSPGARGRLDWGGGRAGGWREGVLERALA